MFKSIRWRIALPYVLLIAITMLSLGIYLSSYFRQTYLQQLEGDLLAQARLGGENLAPLLAKNTSPVEFDTLARDWSRLIGARVTIIAADGTVLGESHEDRVQMGNHLSRPEVQQAIQTGQGASTRFSHTVGYEMMYTAVPILVSGQQAGFIRLALPLQSVETSLSHLQRTLIGSTLLAAMVAVILAMLIANQTTLSLRELTNAATQISKGDLKGRLIPPSSDEVGQLTHAFNNMSIQLQNQINALESERSKMAAVLGEMTDGVIIVDQSGEVQLINPAAENMFEVSRQEALGRSLVEVVRNHQLVELWRRSREIGASQTGPVDISAKGLNLQGVAAPLGQALPGSTLLLFQNLTRLRRLETVRRDFISNISHELRTPLASLKALTETLQESALEDPPAARRFLQRMETEVDALSLMVQELLELSRIESGRVPIQFAIIRPNLLVDAAVDRLRLQAERSGLELEVNCPTELPDLLADRTRLEQVLVNLLHNAIKFTSSGGKITVVARAAGDKVVFSVSDTGVGIPAADLPRIFERFYKADRARSSGGTGLGLAIARHLVEAHRGSIWAESSEGQGSTFYFSIPTA